MSTLKEEYVEQLMAHMNRLGEVLFPKELMEEFERTSQEMIAAGTNLCPCGEKTTQRIYPVGNHWNGGWICKKDAQSMWEKGILHGAIVFDMAKETH